MSSWSQSVNSFYCLFISVYLIVIGCYQESVIKRKGLPSH